MNGHPTTTDGVWRVMRFEAPGGKWAEVASNRFGPEAAPIPSGYRFVKSTPMVPCDDAAIERAARGVSAAANADPFVGEIPFMAAHRIAEAALRAAGEAA